MLYDIRLEIVYGYANPAQASRSLLRMMPRVLPGQQLLSGSVDTDPAPSWRRDRTDFYGNPMTEVAHEMKHDRLRFLFSGRVNRTAPARSLDLSVPLRRLPAEVAGTFSIAPGAPHHFLGPSPRIPDEPEIAAFARDCVSGDVSTLDAIRAVAHRLYEEFDFDPTATQVTTKTITAFRNRRGVCQDISHVAIAALRALGIPAGYVSGFLRTTPPPGRPRLEGADAMHAWVMAWTGPETGWIQVDPTNDIDAGADHVTVATGRDYSDVAPIRGALRSSGGHSTLHRVDMIPVGEAPGP